MTSTKLVQAPAAGEDRAHGTAGLARARRPGPLGAHSGLAGALLVDRPEAAQLKTSPGTIRLVRQAGKRAGACLSLGHPARRQFEAVAAVRGATVAPAAILCREYCAAQCPRVHYFGRHSASHAAEL